MNVELLDRFIAMSSTTQFVVAGEDGRIQAANPAFVRDAGNGADEVVGRSFYDYLTAADATRVERWLADGAPPPKEPVRLNFVRVDGAPYTLRCVVDREGESLRVAGEPEESSDRNAADELMSLNNELATMARERVRRQRELERTQRELQDVLDKLQSSFWHLEKMQEVLPLCMRCGKVKTDEARWQTLVEYLKENEILLSHAYCPTCTDLVVQEHGVEDAPQE